MPAASTVTPPAPRERGLGYALAGGLAITAIAVVIGGLLFGWLLLATRGPSAPELLPGDVQLYAATTPNIGGVVEVAQLRSVLQDGLGVPEPAALIAPIETLLGVSVREHIAPWLGSEVAVAVRGADPARLRGADPGASLLEHAEVLFLFASKNDPQALAFLERHRAAREARGETIAALERQGATIYYAEGGASRPIAVFALIHHYVVFSNSLTAVEHLAVAGGESTATLAHNPAFTRFQARREAAGAIYTDGSPAAEAVRAALRDVLMGLA
ncbi:MAG: DUF3352 domain-containing protein [Oscillochloridaceae bacterium]|nr:DUF3352 domain-containing protein [Chloroflexaceae bacterium]MDW8391590.1 DUF3352 domain-containing protein [Oscillochloridaceae bacterium]